MERSQTFLKKSLDQKTLIHEKPDFIGIAETELKRHFALKVFGDSKEPFSQKGCQTFLKESLDQRTLRHEELDFLIPLKRNEDKHKLNLH